MSRETAHTPTPWSLTIGGQMVVSEGRIPVIADCRTPNGEANAAFILRACNSHDALVAAAENAATVMLSHVTPSDCTAYDWARVVDATEHLLAALKEAKP